MSSTLPQSVHERHPMRATPDPADSDPAPLQPASMPQSSRPRMRRGLPGTWQAGLRLSPYSHAALAVTSAAPGYLLS